MVRTTRFPRLPPFDTLLAAYPNLKDSVQVKRDIGGAIDDTGAPPDQQWLGGTDLSRINTCTIRISRCLNYSGSPVPGHEPHLTTVHGRDGRNYAFRVREMRQYLVNHFGPPTIDLAGPPVSREQFAGKKGLIAFVVPFADATGHLDLWDGQTFFDEIYGVSRPEHDFFDMATRVSLWVSPGTASLSPPADV